MLSCKFRLNRRCVPASRPNLAGVWRGANVCYYLLWCVRAMGVVVRSICYSRQSGSDPPLDRNLKLVSDLPADPTHTQNECNAKPHGSPQGCVVYVCRSIYMVYVFLTCVIFPHLSRHHQAAWRPACRWPSPCPTPAAPGTTPRSTSSGPRPTRTSRARAPTSTRWDKSERKNCRSHTAVVVATKNMEIGEETGSWSWGKPCVAPCSRS